MFWAVIINILYWSVCFVSAFDVDYIYEYSLEIKIILMSFMYFIYKIYDSARYSSCFLLILIHIIYSCALWFKEIDANYFLIETYLFSLWAAWILFRPEYKQQPYNTDNILLAFYRSKNGSFIMHFFDLFGLSAKSITIIAGGKCLTLKSNKDGFQFIDSRVLLKNKENYLIVDTGKQVTKEFVEDMKNEAGKSATKYRFRIVCIMGIKGLLSKIGGKFEPASIFDNIPARYLRKVLIK